jgi:hypothetical protein
MTLENARENKSNWIASNWFRLAALLLAFGSISFYFYWYSIRPSQIKQACSWVTKTKPAIAYRAAMTVAEMQEKGMLQTCEKSARPIPETGVNFSESFEEHRINVIYNGCLEDNKKAIAKYTKEQVAVPAKSYQERATKEEYTFCLHDKGL